MIETHCIVATCYSSPRHSQEKQGPDIPPPHSMTAHHEEQPMPWLAQRTTKTLNCVLSVRNLTSLLLICNYTLVCLAPNLFSNCCSCLSSLFQHLCSNLFFSILPSTSQTDSSHTLAPLRLSMNIQKFTFLSENAHPSSSYLSMA